MGRVNVHEQCSSRYRDLRGARRLIFVALCWMTLPASVAAQAPPSDADHFLHEVIPRINAFSEPLPPRGSPDAKLNGPLLETAKTPPTAMASRQIEVDIVADVTPALLRQIAQLGGTVINQFPRDQAIRAKLPAAALRTIAASPDVKFITPAARQRFNQTAGLVQGDIAHRSDVARSTFNVTGAGVNVCVLSDSIDNNQNALASAQTSKDVPANLTIVPGQAGTGEAEGLAMLEIIHKIVPDAALTFATTESSAAQMAQNISDLAFKFGCKIIVDDETSTDEPPFQDWTVAQAINQVTAAGVLYFTSTGNFGNYKHGYSGTWEGDFADGGAGVGAHVHLFAPNTPYAKVTSPTSRIDLSWSDPWQARSNRYALILFDANDNVLGFASNSVIPYVSINLTSTPITFSGRPRNQLQMLVPGDKIGVEKADGSQPLFLHLDTYGGTIDVGTEGSTHGHNATRRAITVAAATLPDPVSAFTAQAVIDPRSSDGRRRIFFEPNGAAITPGNLLAVTDGGRLLKKPDLAAAACAQTTVPLGQPPSTNFCGSSAAAPYVAAIAALILSYTPSLTPDQVRLALFSSAIDIENPDWDPTSGYGIPMADTALAVAGRMNQVFQDIWREFDLEGRVAAFAADPQYKCTVLVDNDGFIRLITRFLNIDRMFTPQTDLQGNLIGWSTFHDPTWNLLNDISSCGADGVKWWVGVRNDQVLLLGKLSTTPPPLPTRP